MLDSVASAPSGVSVPRLRLHLLRGGRWLEAVWVTGHLGLGLGRLGHTWAACRWPSPSPLPHSQLVLVAGAAEAG